MLLKGKMGLMHIIRDKAPQIFCATTMQEPSARSGLFEDPNEGNCGLSHKPHWETGRRRSYNSGRAKEPCWEGYKLLILS